MDGIATDFLVETVAGLVSVFIGVWLALIVDRKLRQEDQAERRETSRQEFERTRDSILGSVVRNTAESRRIAVWLERQKVPTLLASDLEMAVWSANESQFIGLCADVGMRVLFAQFFDSLRRLQGHLDFRNHLVAGRLAGGMHASGCEGDTLFGDIDRQLGNLAEDVHFTGVLLITDHGTPVHRKMFAGPVS